MKKLSFSFVLSLVFAFAVLLFFSHLVYAVQDLYGVYITQNSISINVSSQVAINGNLWTAGSGATQTLNPDDYIIFAACVEISTSVNIGNIASNNNSIVVSSPTAINGGVLAASGLHLVTTYPADIRNVVSNENFVSIKDAPNLELSNIYASLIAEANARSAGDITSNSNKVEIVKVGKAAFIGSSYITMYQVSDYGYINSNGNEILISSSNIESVLASGVFLDNTSSQIFKIISDNNKIEVSYSTITRLAASWADIYTDGWNGTPAQTNGNIVSIVNSYYGGSDIFDITGGFASGYRSFSNGNQISIDGISPTSAYNINIAGGKAQGEFSAQANQNSVNVKNIKDANDSNIYGGIIGTSIISLGNLYDANQNSVYIENFISTGSFNVYGGKNDAQGSIANTNRNSVHILNSPLSKAYGGYVYNDDGTITVQSASNENFIRLENSNADVIYGGYSYSGNTKISTDSVNGTGLTSNFADGNEVYFMDGNLKELYGGRAQSQTANAQSNENIVNAEKILNIEKVFGGYAASTANAAAVGNSVNIKTAQNINNSIIAGGYIEYAKNVYLQGNSVNLFNSEIYASHIIGGYLAQNADNANASYNNVVFDSVAVYGRFIAGGYAENVENDVCANNNNILIKNNSVIRDVAGIMFGGNARSNNGNAAANGNKIEIDDSVFYFEGGICAGVTEGINGRADDNYIKLKNVSGTIYNGIAGGGAYGLEQAFANGNEIVIENVSANVGSITGGVAIGNFDGGQIEAVNNIISITGNLTTNGNIYGGFAINNGTGGTDFHSGNTLNVIGGQITAYGIGGFENYNFYIDNLNAANPVIYASSGDGNSNFGSYGVADGALDISSTNIKIFLPANTNIGIGQEIRLIESGLGFTGEPNSSEITAKQGVAWFNTFDIYVDTAANVLNAGLIEKTLNPQTKNLSESIAAGAALVGQGADIAGGLLGNIQEGKLEVLGAIFGGSSKYDTGSSVEINALGVIAGAAKKFKPLTAGIFVEYADGSYDTENDFDGSDSVKGDGKASYTGGGLLVKKDIKENLYIEGQARAGQITNDYKTDLADIQGNTADFDYSAIYFGVNIGAGYKYKVSEKVTVKGYGKYIFTNVGGGDADLSTGEKYEFDAVMSNRIKAGIKGAYEISEKVKPYIGIGYDYEISGEIKGKIGGEKIAAPTLNGGTFQGEAGASVKVIENLNIDVSAQIYTGAREGFAGVFKLKYEI